MSIHHPRTCRECGARLSAEAEACDLCGVPVEAVEETAEDASVPAEPAPPPEASMPVADVTEQPPAPDGVHCNQCGWRNPVEARFCSMCGSRLQDLAPAVPKKKAPSVPGKKPARPPARPSTPQTPAEAAPVAAPKQAEHRAVSRQIGIIVGAGVLLVVALFLVTAVSKNQPAALPAEAVQPAAPSPMDAGSLPPLPSPLAEQVESIEAEIAGLEGEARVARQRELVSLLFGAGRLDRAALEQQKMAEAQNDPEDWKRAGDLFYDWMVTLEGQPKAQVAQQAIAAYQRVLEVDPDNLDVRTDMATAYLSSNNPMQGVQEIRRVLDADPNHLHALFNYGIMLSMIGRKEQALEQFEKVKTLVDADSRYYQQADEAIRVIRQGGNL